MHTQWLTHLVQSTDPDLEPAFAYASAVNWIRAFAMLVEPLIADPVRYVRTQVRPVFRNVGAIWPPQQPAVRRRLSLCLTPVYMATNFANTLDHLAQTTTGDRLWSTLSSAMVTWYYSVYYLFQGFLAAMDGTTIDTHAEGQRIMNDKNRLKLLLPPFNLQCLWGGKWNTPALAPAWPSDGQFLRRRPQNQNEAQAAVGAYFTGTWVWFAHRTTERVKKENQLPDFRTKAAQALRDAALQQVAINFLHCVYRYRTKANYRDAIFATYGSQFSGLPTEFLRDLLTLYKAIALGVEAYVCRRVHITRYQHYIDDVARHQRDTHALFPTRFQGPAVLAGMT